MSLDIKSIILYEDNHLLVINKPACMLVQSDTSGDAALEDILKSYIKMRDSKPGNVYLGVVHRIDRPVSGVVIFAKSSKSLARLNEMVKNRNIEKIYWAITPLVDIASSATLTHHIERNPQKNRSYAYDRATKNSKEATLSYKFISSGDKYRLVEVNLLTGRHHQIRCQLSKIGSPIKGDLKYGAPRSNPGGSISLHARSVTFTHPVKVEEIRVIAPTPKGDKLWQYFEQEITKNK